MMVCNDFIGVFFNYLFVVGVVGFGNYYILSRYSVFGNNNGDGCC